MHALDAQSFLQSHELHLGEILSLLRLRFGSGSVEIFLLYEIRKTDNRSLLEGILLRIVQRVPVPL
jgi:hypothetical protein